MDVWAPYVKLYFDLARDGVRVDGIAHWLGRDVWWAAEGLVSASVPPSTDGWTRLLLEGDLPNPTGLPAWEFQPMHLRIEHVAGMDHDAPFARTLTTVDLKTTNESRELDDPFLFSTMYDQVLGEGEGVLRISVTLRDHWLDLLMRYGLSRGPGVVHVLTDG
jgi:hypothetical protein